MKTTRQRLTFLVYQDVIKFCLILMAAVFVTTAINAELIKHPAASIILDTGYNSSSGNHSKLTFEEVFAIFVEVYGNDPRGWPAVVARTDKFLTPYILEKDASPKTAAVFTYLRQFNYDKDRHCECSTFLDLILAYDSFADSVADNYFDCRVMLSYYPDDRQKQFLAHLLLTFTDFVPPGMLRWYFREVFPVLSYIYGVTDKNEILKVGESLEEHVKKLYNNYEDVRAGIWIKFLERARVKSLITQRSHRDYVTEIKSRLIAGIDAHLNTMLPMGPIELRSPNPKFDNIRLADLVISQSKNMRMGTLHINPSFVTKYGDIFEITEQYSTKVGPVLETLDIHYQKTPTGRFGEKFYHRFLEAKLIFECDRFLVLRHHDPEENSYYQEALFIADETGLNLPIFTMFFQVNKVGLDVVGRGPDAGGVTMLPVPPSAQNQLRAILTRAFIESARDVFSDLHVPPSIYGFPEPKKAKGIKATPNPRRIKIQKDPTAELTIQLYDYIPGDASSVRPLANAEIDLAFAQDSHAGGVLSTTRTFTDENGFARISYTAPTIEQVRESGEFSVIIKASHTDEKTVEDLAYITFEHERGRVFAEPSIDGIVSNHAIVPPDRRFPAVIKFFHQDENLAKVSGVTIDFSLDSSNPHGKLQVPGNQERLLKVSQITDNEGFAEVFYYYDQDDFPEKPLIETIKISGPEIIEAFTASVSIGLNLAIASVESGYDESLIVNAGESVPLKVRIIDLWNPALDISELFYFWGVGSRFRGMPSLNLNLQIEKTGEIPEYLLDKIKIKRFPEAGINEVVDVKSFRKENVFNMLMIRESSRLGYSGYPKIKPSIAGQNNYRMSISVVDNRKNELFKINNEKHTAYFSLKTGIPADAISESILTNPFGKHTRQARIFRTILSLTGYGAILDLFEIADIVNRGNEKDALKKVISMALAKIISEAGKMQGVTAEAAKEYSKLTTLEQIMSIAIEDQEILSVFEQTLVETIAELIPMENRKTLILIGNGSQTLINKTNSRPVNATINKITEDSTLNVKSIRRGKVSIYIIPAEFEYTTRHTTKLIELH